MTAAAAGEAWWQGGGVLLPLVPAALVVGLAVRRGLPIILGEAPPRPGRGPVVELALAGLAIAGWWWEVWNLGQLPLGGASVDEAAVCLRLVAHLLLVVLLAAAAWVDLRHRVIPDAITVPGVLAGLAWNALFPTTLLPIGRPVERSFAPPELVPDVLGAFGPLAGSGVPAWLAGAAGLASMLLIFAAWWWFGLPTAAGEPSAAHGEFPAEPWPRWLNPAVALAGGLGIVATWLTGAQNWAGLVTALVGLAVAAGIIWSVRVGASLALGREAMGFGDVTLMAMAGAWLGWQPCVLACVLAVFIGLAHGLTQLVRHSESELPFGPSLCLALAAVVIAWRPLWQAAAPQFEDPAVMAAVVAFVIVMTAATLAVWARLRRRG